MEEEKKEIFEEEKKDEVKEEAKEEKKEPKKEKKDIDIKSYFNVLFAFAALVLMAITDVVVIFCRVNPRIFRGIMGIFAYGCAICGVFLSYMKEKKPTIDFWINVGALIALFRFF